MLKEIVDELRNDCNADGVALIGRDGVPIAYSLPENVKSDTFSIMCATMLGAALTAASELKTSLPKWVTVEGADLKMVITHAGRKALIAVVVKAGVKSELLYPLIESAVEKIKQQMGA